MKYKGKAMSVLQFELLLKIIDCWYVVYVVGFFLSWCGTQSYIKNYLRVGDEGGKFLEIFLQVNKVDLQ